MTNGPCSEHSKFDCEECDEEPEACEHGVRFDAGYDCAVCEVNYANMIDQLIGTLRAEWEHQGKPGGDTAEAFRKWRSDYLSLEGQDDEEG